jgi:hypothetical protein
LVAGWPVAQGGFGFEDTGLVPGFGGVDRSDWSGNGPTLTSATNKREAEFCTTDRIGDDVPVNGCPLLFPGSKSRFKHGEGKKGSRARLAH